MVNLLCVSAATGGVPAELAGMEWTLRRYARGGLTQEPPQSRVEVVLRLSADGRISGTDGCNYWGADVTINGAQLTVGSVVRTLRGCSGIDDLTDAVATIFHGHVHWALDDKMLTLISGDGTRLVYTPRTSIFPSDRPGFPAPDVLVEGTRGTAAYRTFYRASSARVVLEMEHRAAPGRSWSLWGTTMNLNYQGPQPDPMACHTSLIAGDRFTGGLATREVTRLILRPLAAGEDINLPIYPLPAAPEIRAYGGFVGNPARGSQVIAYDPADNEMGPPHAPHWRVPGDPI